MPPKKGDDDRKDKRHRSNRYPKLAILFFTVHRSTPCGAKQGGVHWRKGFKDQCRNRHVDEVMCLVAQTLRVLIVLQLIGLAEILLSVPLLLNRIPPNPWYGWPGANVRASKDRWYAANHFFGKALLVAGSLLFTGCSFLWPMLPHLNAEHVTTIGYVMTLLPLAVAIGVSRWYIRRLP